MAISSITKTFVFNSAETEKIKEIQKMPGKQIPASCLSRIEEGRKALEYFSSCGNKNLLAKFSKQAVSETKI